MSYCWEWVTLLRKAADTDTHSSLSGLSARRSNACEAISRIEQNFRTLKAKKKNKNVQKPNKNRATSRVNKT